MAVGLGECMTLMLSQAYVLLRASHPPGPSYLLVLIEHGGFFFGFAERNFFFFFGVGGGNFFLFFLGVFFFFFLNTKRLIVMTSLPSSRALGTDRKKREHAWWIQILIASITPDTY